jgi:hypothetical protein
MPLERNAASSSSAGGTHGNVSHRGTLNGTCASATDQTTRIYDIGVPIAAKVPEYL